jgi:hypothetical protein
MLNAAQRTFIVNEQTIVPAVFNLALNAGLGWVVFKKLEQVPLWGDPSIAGDVVGTLFFLPFLTCLIVTPLVKRAARTGKVEWLSIAPGEHPVLRLFPRSVWLRALLVGLASVVLFGLPLLGLLALLGVEGWSVGTMVSAKGIYAALIAALVTPYLALYALAGSEEPATPSQQPAR